MLLLPLALGACEAPRVRPASPSSADAAGSVPDPGPSVVTAPVVLDLRPLVAELERSLPRAVGAVEEQARVQVDRRPAVWLAARLERTPLDVTFRDSTVHVSAVVRYRGRAWVNALVAEPSVSCGLDGEPPRLRVSIASTWSLTREWRIRSRSRVTALDPATDADRDRCTVSVVDWDVTDRVVEGARNALESALTEADRRVGRIDLRASLDQVWAEMQEPISIEDGLVWFVIRPRAVSLGGIQATDSTLVATLTLRAEPRFLTGGRPDLPPTRLPPLERAAAGDHGAVFRTRGLLDYDLAGRLLDDALAGDRIRDGWRRLLIRGVEARYGGGGRVAIAVDLAGGARGRIWAVGTPHLDRGDGSVHFPDLGFDVESRSALEESVGWVLEGPLLEHVRERARIPATRLLGKAVELANRELDRELTDGVHLRGTIRSERPLGVAATPGGLVAQAEGSGDLRLEVSRRDLVPEIPDPVATLRVAPDR